MPKIQSYRRANRREVEKSPLPEGFEPGPEYNTKNKEKVKSFKWKKKKVWWKESMAQKNQKEK